MWHVLSAWMLFHTVLSKEKPVWKSLSAQETLKIFGMSVVRVLEQSCVALWSVSQPLVTEETLRLRRTSCCAPGPSTPVETEHLLQAVLHLVS